MVSEVFLYETEPWITSSKQGSTLQVVQMRYLGSVRECMVRYFIVSDVIGSKQKVYNKNRQAKDYREKIKEHISMVEDEWMKTGINT